MGCGGSKETVAAESTRTRLRKPDETKKPDDPKGQISEEFSTTFPETIYKAEVHKQDIHVQEETKKPMAVSDLKKEEEDVEKERKEMKDGVLVLKGSANEKGEQEVDVDEKEEGLVSGDKEEDENAVISVSTETTSTETTTMARVEEPKSEAKVEEERSLAAESNQVAHE